MLDEIYLSYNKPAKKSGVYCITNIVSNKIYVGSSCNIYNRFKAHKASLKRSKHHNNHLQKSWNANGEQSFIFVILELCDCSLLIEKEQYYMDKYKSHDRKYGYNLIKDIKNKVYTKDVIEKLKTSQVKRISDSKSKSSTKEFCKHGHVWNKETAIVKIGKFGAIYSCKECAIISGKRYRKGKQRLKPYCEYGHKFDDNNTIFTKLSNGTPNRICKQCFNKKLENNKIKIEEDKIKSKKYIREFCFRGHKMTEENTEYRRNKTDNSVSRVCKLCKNNRIKNNELDSPKTHCSRGHLLNDSNVYEYKGRRQCRICLKESRAKYRSKNKN